jgi:hypothetical protein
MLTNTHILPNVLMDEGDMSHILIRLFSTLGFALVIVANLGSPVLADRQIRVCIGQYDNKCPVIYDAFFGCGTTLDTAATNVCTITRNGKKEVLPYQIIHQGDHSGNRCGYVWFLVICIY